MHDIYSSINIFYFYFSMALLSSLTSYFKPKQEPSLIGLLEVSVVKIPRNKTVTVEYNRIETILDINNTKATYDIFSIAEPVWINKTLLEITDKTVEIDRATVSIRVIKTKVKIKPEDFTRIKLIGKGSSKVYLVQYNRSERLYACKVFKKSKKSNNLINEKNLLIRLKNSPFLIPLLLSFQSPTELFLIFPYYKYDLFTLLLLHPLSEYTARIYFCELLLIINHLHGKGIIYRDIKPENILIDSNNHVLLCDLDLSVDSSEASTYYGTLEYVPPEIIKNEKYNESYDYYALGILLYEMTVGYTPHRIEPGTISSGEEEEELKNRILYEEIDYASTGITKELIDLIDQLTNKSPNKRISHTGIVKHKWIEEIDWHKIRNREYRIEIEVDLTKKETEAEDSQEEDSYKTTVPGFTWIGEDWEEE